MGGYTLTTQQQELNQLLLKLSNAGRSTSWGHERRLTSTRHGVLLADEYTAVIFKRHSSRIDVMLEANNIELLIEDVTRFIKDNNLDWTMPMDGEPF